MEIKIRIDGKEKIFASNFISARLLRRTLEVSKKVNFNDMSPEELDTMVDFIVEVFENKFTRDDIYDGIASKDLIPTITNCINEIVGEVAIVTGVDEKNEVREML